MSNTPRTDEIIKDFVSGNGEAASIMLLRQDVEQLENELADKDRQLAEAQAEIERLKKNLRLLLCKKHLEACENSLFNSRYPDDEPCLICLIEAVERGE